MIKRNYPDWPKRTVIHGRYGPQVSLAEAYQNGFATGRVWVDDHVPGGPHVTSAAGCQNNSDRDRIAFCEHSAKVHSEYMRGWNDGRVAAT